MKNNWIYESRLDETWRQIIRDISAISDLQEFSNTQITLILSMQKWIEKWDDWVWRVKWKKKSWWKLDFDKFLKNFKNAL